MLTADQRERISKGENAYNIIREMDADVLGEVERISEEVQRMMTPEQMVDLRFISSGAFHDFTLEERWQVLKHLNENNGRISYPDLVNMGICIPDELLGTKLTPEQKSKIGRGTHELAALFELEYQLNRFGTSIYQMSEIDRRERNAQQVLTFALSIVPWVDWKINYEPGRVMEYGSQNSSQQASGADITITEGAGSKWFKADGTPKWPDNDGFTGTPSKTTLQPGTKIDRYGSTSGKFVAPEGTPYGQRALPPGAESSPYNSYEVIKPFEVNSGTTAPWFDQPGGGTQYQTPMSMQDLIDQGFIK